MTDKQEAKLVEYYFLYKNLVLLHRKFEFGDAPRTSEGFTEAICCNLFGFKKAMQVKREYDLDDPKNNLRIKVKATTDGNGSTTINPRSKFDFLYWINFRLDIDVLHVEIKSFDLFGTFFQKYKNEKRVNVILSKFGERKATYYRFNAQRKVIEPLSTRDYLIHIGEKLGTKVAVE